MKAYKQNWTDFTVVPNVIFKHGLSLKAIGLYVYIVNKPDGWDFSIRGTATQTKDGEDSVRSAVNELEAVGFLKRTKYRNSDGTFGDGIWYVYDRVSENPTAVNPTQVNQPQVSIKKERNNSVEIQGGSTSPNPTASLELANLLRKKADRKARRALGSASGKGFSSGKLTRDSGLEISLRDSLDENAMNALAEKHGITTKQVAECKQDYINWIMSNSFAEKAWGRDMVIMVDTFCSRKASKAKPKKDDSEPDEMNDDLYTYYDKKYGRNQ